MIDIRYEPYCSNSPIQELKDIIDKELSEPYSIFTYYYFLKNYPELTYLVSML